MSAPTNSSALEPPCSKRQRREEPPLHLDVSSVSALSVPPVDRSRAVILFVGGLPQRVNGLRKLLKTAMINAWNDAHQQSNDTSISSNGVGLGVVIRNVKILVNAFNHVRTFAQVCVRDANAANFFVNALHLRLRLPGTPTSHPPLSFSISQFKLDGLFPFLPAHVRGQLRLDSTALFSVTDQEYAQRTTQLLLILSAVAARDPTTPLQNTLKVTKSSRSAAMEDAAMSAAKVAAAAAVTIPASEEMKDTTATTDDADDAADGMHDSVESGGSDAAVPCMIYSPDAEINRIVTEIAECSWSTWTDLEVNDGLTNTLPPLRIARSPLSITDACACAGGNALDFGRHFARTHAIEFDSNRASDLRTNVQLLRLNDSVQVHEGDANVVLPTLSQDLLYVDPPWRGPNYKELMAIDPELYLGDRTLPDICWDLYERGACRIISMRLPFEYDADALARRMVSIPPSLMDQAKVVGCDINPFDVPRPFPFRVLQGKLWLVVFCLPSAEEKANAHAKIFGSNSTQGTVNSPSTHTAAAAASSSSSSSPSLHFNLNNLDSLIYSLNGYNIWHNNECDPAFFDYEKCRWISTRRWRGCTGKPAEKTIPPHQQAILEMEGKNKKNIGGKLQSEQQVKRKQERQIRYKEKQNQRQIAKIERRQARATQIAEENDATIGAATQSSTPLGE
jgi:hypothetical protein